MTTHLDELDRLTAHEPVFTGSPDLDAIRRSGRRLRARRRVATGVATLAVVAGVTLPVAAMTAQGSDATAPVVPATSSTPQSNERWMFAPIADLRTDLPDGCGAFACVGDGTAESGQIVGEPWAVAGIPADLSGLHLVDEVIYAVRPSPGERPVVALGLRDGDEVRRVAILFRPGRDFRDTPLRITGAEPREGWEGTTYAMLGMVEENPVSTVAWQTGTGPWSGAPLNDELVPGYGVFWLVDQWQADWPADQPARVTVRVDGREYAAPRG